MKQAFTLLCLALAFIVTSCQHTVNTVENADKSMHLTRVYDKRVVSDGFLMNRLALTDLIVTQTSDGIMRVQISATNMRTDFWGKVWSSMTGTNPYPIQYKFSWFDKNGMELVGVLSDWQEITIIPGQTVTIQSVAPTKDAKDFKLNLKEK